MIGKTVADLYIILGLRSIAIIEKNVCMLYLWGEICQLNIFENYKNTDF